MRMKANRMDRPDTTLVITEDFFFSSAMDQPGNGIITGFCSRLHNSVYLIFFSSVTSVMFLGNFSLSQLLAHFEYYACTNRIGIPKISTRIEHGAKTPPIALSLLLLSIGNVQPPAAFMLWSHHFWNSNKMADFGKTPFNFSLIYDGFGRFEVEAGYFAGDR